MYMYTHIPIYTYTHIHTPKYTFTHIFFVSTVINNKVETARKDELPIVFTIPVP